MASLEIGKKLAKIWAAPRLVLKDHKILNKNVRVETDSNGVLLRRVVTQ
jgi:hypothetical protein